jgi:hypothetical protein
MPITLKPYIDLNIIYTFGDDINIQIVRQDLSGTVINITGYSYVASIRKVRGATVFLNIPVTLTTPLSGLLTLAEVTANLTTLVAGSYYWDLEETNSNGITTTIFKGDFIVESE